jgi:hypothetical protein
MNHVFHCAMDVRYRTLDLSLCPETNIVMSLGTNIKLRNTSTLSRVRRLYVSDRCIPTATPHTWLGGILPAVLKLTSKRKNPVAQLESDPLLESKQHLLCLSHIDTVEINLGQRKLHHGKP